MRSYECLANDAKAAWLIMQERNIVLRKFQKEDLTAVLRLLQDVSRYTPDADERYIFAQEFLASSNSLSLVATDGDEVLGFGSLIIYQRLRGGKTALLEDIVADRSLRRSGVGSMIVKELLAHAKKQDCFKVMLEANEESESFYTSLDFKRGGALMKLAL